jgi:N-acylneuraminate cytidylyltransferase
MNDKILALIPARGGSKGIPHKNIIELLGKPLIAYSIEHAQRSRYINRIIVSTDDPDIARVARAWGAEIPFMRPAEYAQDLSPDLEVFRHTLAWLDEHENYEPELVVHLRPPGPVRKVELIDKAIELLLHQPHADALRSIGHAKETPYKMWRLTDEGLMEPLLRIDGMTDAQSQPRQKLPQVYWQNGYVDVIRPRAVLMYNSMWGQKVIPYLVNERLYELDYPEDIPAVEAALRAIEQGIDLDQDVQTGRHSV